MNSKFKIYMLTLENSRRHLYHVDRFRRLGLECNFIFGKNFSDDFISQHVDKNSPAWKLSMFSNERHYLNRAYSCADGHNRMLEAFLESGDADVGLFLEDDMEICENAEKILSELPIKFNAYKIWHLATEAVREYQDLFANRKTDASYAGVLEKRDVMRASAAAYAATREGAAALLRKNSPVRGPSDAMMFDNPADFAVVYGSGFMMNADFQANSEIGNRRLKVLIPFKEHSVRCEGKNFKLFPYVADQIKRAKISQKDVYVVSASESVRQFVVQYGFNFIKEREMPHGSNNILACHGAAKDLGLSSYVELPLTQPIRDYGIIKTAMDKLNSDATLDFVTSKQEFTDRRLFFIDERDRFVYESANRKGCMCKTYDMVDGAVYAIRTSFIDEFSESPDTNGRFWAGKFATVPNDVDFFVDVDTERDLDMFSFLSGEHHIQKNQPDDYFCKNSAVARIPCNDLHLCETARKLTINDLCRHSLAISINNTQYKMFSSVMRYYGFPDIAKYEGFKFHHMSISTKKCLRLELTNDAIAVPNCSYTHAAIIKMAKYLDWPFVCIFEDDAYPVREITEKIAYYLTNIPASVKLLLLGHTYFQSNGQYLYGKKYVGVQEAHGSHAYILFKNGYDAYIDVLSKSNCIADLVFSYMPGCYSTAEILFTQCNFVESSISGKTGLWNKQIGQEKLAQIFENPEFFKKPLKKLILVGNKDIQTDISDKINEFDFIVRLNRMNNYGKTGVRTDLLLADPHGEFMRIVGDDHTPYISAKKLLLNTSQSAAEHKQECLDRGIFTEEQYQNAYTFCLHDYANTLIPDCQKNNDFPTNFFIMLNWCIERFSNDYEIWITGVDVDGREKLFKEDKTWSRTWHKNAGKIEEAELKRLLRDNIIHELKC